MHGSAWFRMLPDPFSQLMLSIVSSGQGENRGVQVRPNSIRAQHPDCFISPQMGLCFDANRLHFVLVPHAGGTWFLPGSAWFRMVPDTFSQLLPPEKHGKTWIPFQRGPGSTATEFPFYNIKRVYGEGRGA